MYSFEVAVAVNSDSIVMLVRHFLALLHCYRNHKKATDHMQGPPPQFSRLLPLSDSPVAASENVRKRISSIVSTRLCPYWRVV